MEQRVDVPLAPVLGEDPVGFDLCFEPWELSIQQLGLSENGVYFP